VRVFSISKEQLEPGGGHASRNSTGGSSSSRMNTSTFALLYSVRLGRHARARRPTNFRRRLPQSSKRPRECAGRSIRGPANGVTSHWDHASRETVRRVQNTAILPRRRCVCLPFWLRCI